MTRNSTPYLKFFLLLSCFLPALLIGQVFVKSDAAGKNDGSSWINAYTNLDTALSKTMTGQIWVAKGEYIPTKTLLYYNYPAFSITRNIALLGGFKGNESSVSQRNVETNLTILSADIGVYGKDDDNSPAVICISGTGIDSTCILDGFTITKAHYSDYKGYEYRNGAVRITTDIYDHGSPVVRNCTIKENFGFSGSGIYVRSTRPLITDNLITNNTAYSGAGIYLDDGVDAKIVRNKITFNRCVGGYTSLSGGGIRLDAYSTAHISENLIDNNEAGTTGGGISVQTNYAAIIENNIISNNKSIDGGGIYVDFAATSIVNNLVTGNIATGNGGGLYVNYSLNTVSFNNTIVKNSAGNYGGAVYMQDGNMRFVNTIIYNNPTRFNKQFNCYNANRTDWFPKISYSIIEGGIDGINFSDPSKLPNIWLEGNIKDSPIFAGLFNFRLKSGSPGINAGSPDTSGLSLPLKDAAGSSRYLNKRIDIGCYEFDSSFVSKDSLVVTPSQIELEGWRDSSFYITVKSTIPWKLAGKPEWVTLDSAENGNPAKLKFTAKATTDRVNARTGSLTFSSTGIELPFTVSLNQGSASYIQINPDTVYLGAFQNDTAFAQVFSNLYWYPTFTPYWASFSNTGDLWNRSGVKITALSTNNTGHPRIAVTALQNSETDYYPLVKKQLVVIQLSSELVVCQNGDNLLIANTAGTIYQWQADTGTGFINLKNDAYYKGVNNRILQLHTIPSAYYGYRYRCVVDNVADRERRLTVQNSWVGSLNTAWDNPLHWSCGIVPDQYTDVIVNQGTLLISKNTTIRSLNIAAGASVSVAAGVHLTILH